mgnify:CR=1 FL=1
MILSDLKVNDLVTHKKMKSLGIGCISKVLKNQYSINFGINDMIKCNKQSVTPVDTSRCATISFAKVQSRILMEDKNTKDLNHVILGNELKEFVGIGWITLRVVTEQDLKKYPRVV